MLSLYLCLNLGAGCVFLATYWYQIRTLAVILSRSQLRLKALLLKQIFAEDKKRHMHLNAEIGLMPFGREITDFRSSHSELFKLNTSQNNECSLGLDDVVKTKLCETASDTGNADTGS